MAFSRLAGLAGIAFIVLVVINIALLGDAPLSGEEIQKVRTYVEKDQDLHKAAFFLGIVLIPFAVFFFAGVIQRLRASDEAHGEAYAVAALAGAVLLAATSGTGDALQGAAFFRGGEGVSDSTLRALWDGQTIAYASTGAAIATLTLSVALPGLLHQSWPRWHVGLGLIVAVLGLIGLVSVVSATDAGDALSGAAFAGFLLWALVTSVLLVRETTQVAPTARPLAGRLPAH